MGDFNARHRTWDAGENTRGRFLKKYAEHRRWSINAPNENTYKPETEAENKGSTIDLFITQGIHMGKVEVNTGQ